MFKNNGLPELLMRLPREAKLNYVEYVEVGFRTQRCLHDENKGPRGLKLFVLKLRMS